MPELNYVIISGDKILNAPEVPVYDLSFLQYSPDNLPDTVVPRVVEIMEYANDTAVEMLRNGVYDYISQVTDWLTMMGNMKATIVDVDVQKKVDTAIPAKPATAKRMAKKPAEKKDKTTYRARFSDADIREIRETKGPHSAIAERFNTTAATISNIKARKTYKNVE